MRRRVRVRASFLCDLNEQIGWLRKHGSSDQVVCLRDGIREARALLGRFPSAGSIEREAVGSPLRRLLLRRVPYLVWYADDGENVWVLRLFHARQDRLLID